MEDTSLKISKSTEGIGFKLQGATNLTEWIDSMLIGIFRHYPCLRDVIYKQGRTAGAALQATRTEALQFHRAERDLVTRAPLNMPNSAAEMERYKELSTIFKDFRDRKTAATETAVGCINYILFHITEPVLRKLRQDAAFVAAEEGNNIFDLWNAIPRIVRGDGATPAFTKAAALANFVRCVMLHDEGIQSFNERWTKARMESTSVGNEEQAGEELAMRYLTSLNSQYRDFLNHALQRDHPFADPQEAMKAASLWNTSEKKKTPLFSNLIASASSSSSCTDEHNQCGCNQSHLGTDNKNDKDRKKARNKKPKGANGTNPQRRGTRVPYHIPPALWETLDGAQQEEIKQTNAQIRKENREESPALASIEVAPRISGTAANASASTAKKPLAKTESDDESHEEFDV
jgi:hypothetical protein